MKSHKHYQGSAGFTLIETLIVVALVAVLAGFGLVVGIDAYQRSTFRSQQDFLVASLQKARSRALANIGQCNHGVRIEEGSYTTFVEDDGVCDTEGVVEEEVLVEGNVLLEGPGEIVFLRVSGDADIEGTEEIITMHNPNAPDGSEIHVTVGEKGSISWD